jgi:hypothetical protein
MRYLLIVLGFLAALIGLSSPLQETRSVGFLAAVVSPQSAWRPSTWSSRTRRVVLRPYGSAAAWTVDVLMVKLTLRSRRSVNAFGPHHAASVSTMPATSGMKGAAYYR